MAGGLQVGAAVRFLTRPQLLFLTRLQLLVCLGACAGARPARREPFDPEGMLIGRVVILDNRAYDDEAVFSRLATREDRGSLGFPKIRFDPLTFQLDQRRVVAFYRERGYFEAEVVATGFEKTIFGDLLVWLRVREGTPVRVTSVSLSGAPEIGGLKEDEQALLSRADIQVGSVFDHPRYRRAKRRVQGALVNAGFAHAQVRGVVQIDRDTHTAAIELSVDPGPLVRFGETRVESVPSVADAVAARANWKTGDVFDPVRIERTAQRVRAMGLFAGVRVDYEREDRPPVTTVTIHAPSGDRNEAKLGGGVEGSIVLRTDEGPLLELVRFETRVRASYARKRWPWALSQTRLEGKVGVLPVWDLEQFFDELDERFLYEIRATVERWDLGLPMMRWIFGGAFDRKVFEAYTLVGPRVFIQVEYPTHDDRVLWGAGFQLFPCLAPLPCLEFDPDDDVLAAGLGVDNPVHLAFVEQSVTWNSRDEPLDAHRGTYAQLALEEGASPFYLKATGEARAYWLWPRSQRFVAGWRGRAGLLTGLEEDGETPVTQRYYGGGASSHRGFSYRRLSPRLPDASGDQVPVGGGALIETSVEARLDIYGQWGGVAFLDGGDVTAGPEDLSLLNLHWAAGLGVRRDTEVGPFRLDVGVRLNRMGPGEPDAGDSFVDRFVGHVSFGEAF